MMLNKELDVQECEATKLIVAMLFGSKKNSVTSNGQKIDSYISIIELLSHSKNAICRDQHFSW